MSWFTSMWRVWLGLALVLFFGVPVFSVLSWAAFAVLLVGRARFGWRGRKAVRILYVGSLLLLLAYVGSRFVIEVVLGRNA